MTTPQGVHTDGDLPRRGALTAMAVAAGCELAAGGIYVIALIACPSGGLECVPWLIPTQLLFVAGAPTAGLIVPLTPVETTGWVPVALSIATSLPLWALVGRRLARRAQVRHPDDPWPAWKRSFAATMAIATVVAIAIAFGAIELMVRLG